MLEMKSNVNEGYVSEYDFIDDNVPDYTYYNLNDTYSIYNGTYYQDYIENGGFYEIEDFEQICSYTLLSIIILGVCGNVVSIVVFHQGRACRASWCALYFKALALSDIYVLLSSALRRVLIGINFELDIHNVHEVLCKFGWFNYNFCVQLSTWITAAVTIDRAICIGFPMKFPQISATKWIRVKLALIIGVFIAINLVVPIETQYHKVGLGYVTCDFPDFTAWYPLISYGVLVFLLPSIIHVVCNIIILRVLYGRSSSRANIGLAEGQVTSRRTAANYVTYRVIAIGFIHFVSTLPKTIHLLIRVIRELSDSKFSMDLSVDFYVYTVAEFVLFLNSGLNFIFYCITGLDFRRDLKAMLFGPPAASQAEVTSDTCYPMQVVTRRC